MLNHKSAVFFVLFFFLQICKPLATILSYWFPIASKNVQMRVFSELQYD